MRIGRRSGNIPSATRFRFGLNAADTRLEIPRQVPAFSRVATGIFPDRLIYGRDACLQPGVVENQVVAGGFW